MRRRQCQQCDHQKTWVFAAHLGFPTQNKTGLDSNSSSPAVKTRP
jgi:hypothetical protein